MSEPRMNLPEARRWVGVEIRPWHADMSEDVQRAALTIVACGDVAEKIRREYHNVAASNPRPHRDDYAEGYLQALDQTDTWLKEALQNAD